MNPSQPPSQPSPREAEAFIRRNLHLEEVPGTGGLRLHLAGPRSGLSRLVPAGGAPYWAHAWPGGTALALHLASHPEAVRGRAVFDIGMGSGLVAIAALRAGAKEAVGFDPDPLAAIAARINAEANGVTLATLAGSQAALDDALMSFCSATDDPVILAGDVFYDAAVRHRVMAALDAVGGGATILVGDIGRRDLPRDRLEPLACHPVRDVGDPPSAPLRDGWVFRWRHAGGGRA